MVLYLTFSLCYRFLVFDRNSSWFETCKAGVDGIGFSDVLYPAFVFSSWTLITFCYWEKDNKWRYFPKYHIASLLEGSCINYDKLFWLRVLLISLQLCGSLVTYLQSPILQVLSYPISF